MWPEVTASLLNRWILSVAVVIGATCLARRRLMASLLTYDDVVSYLVEKRPPDPRIAKGAMLIDRRTARCICVYLLFLDENNLPLTDCNGRLYGTSRVVGRMDSL